MPRSVRLRSKPEVGHHRRGVEALVDPPAEDLGGVRVDEVHVVVGVLASR
jgi:hypothetical protein